MSDELEPTAGQIVAVVDENRLLRAGLIVNAVVSAALVIVVALGGWKLLDVASDTNQLTGRLLPLVSPKALEASRQTGAYYAGYLDALCKGQNRTSAQLPNGAQVVCVPPVKPAPGSTTTTTTRP